MDGEVRAILLGAAAEPTPNLALGLNAGVIFNDLGTTWSVDYASPDSADTFIRDELETDAMEWIMTLGGAYKVSDRVTVGMRAQLPVGEWDLKMDTARKNLTWDEMINNAIDPDTARAIHHRDDHSDDDGVCSMCGEFCAIKILKDEIEKKN